MEDKNIISAVVDALTGKVIYKFSVPVRYIPERSLFDRLLRKPNNQEKERHFEIWPCVVANQYRIAGKAITLPTELYEDSTKMLLHVNDHLPTMVYIIAAAIQNDHLEPAADLIQFIERNFDNEDIYQALLASLQGQNLQSFLNSIVLMNAQAEILDPKKTSPVDGSE